jgi:hypothetical protein
VSLGTCVEALLGDYAIIARTTYKYFFTNLITPSHASVPRIAATNEYAPKGKAKGSES